jgi:hypothetical protein
MKKRDIKVVKPGAQKEPLKLTDEETLVNKKRSAADDERDMIDSVKGWITERVENSKAEGIRSETDRQAWEAGDPD